jgi:antitoxin VapB
MAFHVRDRTTDDLVRTLAQRRKIGLTDAVRLAVYNELQREDMEMPLLERLRPILRNVSARRVHVDQSDKEFFDELGGDL